jgi:hypothetical protein
VKNSKLRVKKNKIIKKKMMKWIVLSALLCITIAECQPMGLFGDSKETPVSDFFGKIKDSFSQAATDVKEGVEKGASKVYSGGETVVDNVKDAAKDGLDFIKDGITSIGSKK